MKTAERRKKIRRMLIRAGYLTMSDLSREFGVCIRTIQRDIDFLSEELPLYTRCGRFSGGVYLVNSPLRDRIYKEEQEGELLAHLCTIAARCPELLSEEEQTVLTRIISTYAPAGESGTENARRFTGRGEGGVPKKRGRRKSDVKRKEVT